MPIRTSRLRLASWHRVLAGTAAGVLWVAPLAACAAEPGATPAAAGAADAANRSVVDWRSLGKPEYARYLERLREVGCPEDKIRLIVRADADEWLLQQRVAHAVASDFPWWKAEPQLSGAGDAMNDKYEQFRKQRADLVQALIGQAEAPTASGKETPIVVNLCGPVLGALTREKYNAVQEICSRSIDRQQGYFNVRQNEGIFLNQGDLARLREQTRADLSEVLNDAELEEFLLRYSHNANRLRQELAALEPTPDEFRAIFRGVDALEHRLQLEYGALDSLSSRQRETFERQREEAIRKVLPPERYQKYLVGRYPLFRQAQLAVRRAGLAESTVMAFYEVLQLHESRRRELLNNTALAGDQRQAGLRDLEKEKEEGLKKALGDEAYRQYRDSLVN